MVDSECGPFVSFVGSGLNVVDGPSGELECIIDIIITSLNIITNYYGIHLTACYSIANPPTFEF